MSTKNSAPPVAGYVRLGTRAPFDESTAANHEVVAAVSGKKIRLLAWSLWVAGAVDLTWKSATTAKSQTYPVSGAGLWEPLLPFHTLETAAGEALNLTLGGAVAVKGDVWYEVVG